MRIEFKKVEPNKKSLTYELIFTFRVTEVESNSMPLQFRGELYSEDGLKIGDLTQANPSRNNTIPLRVKDTASRHATPDFEIDLLCQLNEKAISHIESYRHNKKERTKDIVFKAALAVDIIESKIQLSHLHFGQDLKEGGNYIYYKYTQHFSSSNSGMWILSGGGENFMDFRNYTYGTLEITIDLMDWINNYTKYLNIGEFIVYEFVQPDEIIFSKTLKARYDKAQSALGDMKKQLNYGEWKQAIVASRPIFELFKNFDDFKKFILENGYTEKAYIELKKSIEGFFGLLSKFYHGLEKNNVDVNPDIPVEKEDAYFAYSYSISLLHLISQKLKRKN